MSRTLTRLGPLVAGALLLACLSPAGAQEACLNGAERRQAVSAGRALPLDQAMRQLRPDQRGEIAGARLCRVGGELLYLLTLVNRHGRVLRVRIDADTGKVLNVR